MFYLPREIDRLLIDTSEEQRDREIDEHIHDLAPRVAVKRNEYRHFGPFWWWVKPFMRRSPASRRTWLRGGYRDRSFIETAEPFGSGTEAFPSGTAPTAGTEDLEEQDRWLCWLGVRYYADEVVDDTPAGFHIVESPRGNTFVYTVYDADASEQLTLFGEENAKHTDLDAFLADPMRYTGGNWIHRAEEYARHGQTFRAAAALRRAINRAVLDDDRTAAWIRLGQLFQDSGHTHKAILCYQNAYHREQEGWIHGLMGAAWLDAGEAHHAVRCYRAALEAMPDNPEYQAGMAAAERAVAETGTITAGYRLAGERLAR